MEQAQLGRTVVLIVDEAHNLEWDVLEEIRLLGNLENRNGKLLQIILAGQPELDRKLDAPNLRQLKQRIVLRCNLHPFTLRDAVEYIQSRLEKAGMPDQTVFPEELMAEIHLRAQGTPRLINAICDNLLLTAFAEEKKVCTKEMLDEISRDLRLEWPGSRRIRVSACRTNPSSGALLGRSRLQRDASRIEGSEPRKDDGFRHPRSRRRNWKLLRP